jgi:hypothetical protein
MIGDMYGASGACLPACGNSMAGVHHLLSGCLSVHTGVVVTLDWPQLAVSSREACGSSTASSGSPYLFVARLGDGPFAALPRGGGDSPA